MDFVNDKFYDQVLWENRCRGCNGAGEISEVQGSIRTIHYYKCEECNGTGQESGGIKKEKNQ